jgi:hypothetical protein
MLQCTEYVLNFAARLAHRDPITLLLDLLSSQVVAESSEIVHLGLEELMHLQFKLLDFFVTCPGDD